MMMMMMMMMIFLQAWPQYLYLSVLRCSQGNLAFVEIGGVADMEAVKPQKLHQRSASAKQEEYEDDFEPESEGEED